MLYLLLKHDRWISDSRRRYVGIHVFPKENKYKKQSLKGRKAF